MRTSINEVIITTHCHATEDCGKVLQAVKNLLPREMHSRINPVIQSYQGYYGNPIKIITITLRGENAEKLLDHIGSRLSDMDKSILDVSLELRYDRRSNKLYIRFDKQLAYRGEQVISDTDDIIKITISLKGPHRLDMVRELLKKHGLVR